MRLAMRPFLCAAALAAAVGCEQGKGSSGAGGGGGAIAWRDDIDQALADAKAAGKPAVIDFHADW